MNQYKNLDTLSKNTIGSDNLNAVKIPIRPITAKNHSSYNTTGGMMNLRASTRHNPNVLAAHNIYSGATSTSLAISHYGKKSDVNINSATSLTGNKKSMIENHVMSLKQYP